MAEPSTHIEAQVGNVSGGSQVAIGNYIVQIGRVEGGVVNILNEAPPPPRLRPQPVCFVPNHFRIFSIEKRKAPLSFNHSTRSSLSSAVANRRGQDQLVATSGAPIAARQAFLGRHHLL
jgi:hypothetical protein